MNRLFFSRVSEADTQVRQFKKSLHYYEVMPKTQQSDGPTLMQCQAIVARALGYSQWGKLRTALHSLGEEGNLDSVRYIDLSSFPDKELTSLLQKLRGAIGFEVDEHLLRLAVMNVGFGYSPKWQSEGIKIMKPLLETGLTRSQFGALTVLDTGWSFATRYGVSPDLYQNLRHHYEVEKAKILGLPKPRKRKYRD